MKPFNIAVFQTTAIIQDQSTSRQHPLPVRPHMDDDGCYSFREYTQVLNVVVETDTDVLSLIRYFPDLVEFDHLIKSHYSKVKIPFPTLTDTAEKRRSFRQFWTSLSQTRVKSDSEKIERYLQKCSLDPTIRSSTIFRDFFSVQREEDRRLSKLEIDRILGQSVAPPLPATEAAATTMTAAASSSSNLDRRRSSSDAVVPEQVSPDTDPVQLGVSEKEVPNEKKAEGTKRLSLAVESHDIVEKNARPQLVEYTASNEDVAKIAPDFPSPYPPPAPAPTAKRPSSQPVVKSSKNPLDQLEMLKVLGKGCMGKVFLVRSKVTNDLYALKSITKELVIEQREITHTLAERDILVALAGADHPFLAKLYLSFQDEHRLYLVTDYYCGGDLATQMSTCTTFSKERTLFYAAEMIEGLGALHRMGVLYRDLKPENILLTVDGHIVLTDFGLSKWLTTDKDGYLQHTQTFCGTAEYLAPEALLGEPYGFGIDYWAYGTILYEMLAGITPFWADNHSDMYHRVLQDPLEFPPDTDYETAEFLAGLLERDPQMRLGVRGGIEEIKSHIYFSGISWDDVYHRRLKPPYVPQLQSALDFANFDPTFLEMSPTLTPVPSQTDLTADMQRVFDGYSFTNETFLVQEQHEEEQEETTTPQVGQDANKALDNNYFSSSNTFDWDDDVKDVDRKRCTMDRIDEQQMEEHRLHNDLHPTFQPARKRGSMSMLSDIDSFHLDGVVSSVGDVSKLATSNGDMLPYSHDDYRKAEQVRYAKRRNTSGSERDAVEDEIDYAYRQQMSESIVVSEQMPLTPQRVPDLSVASTADDLPFDDFELGGISDDLDLKLSFSVQLEHAANNAKAKAGHAASSKSSSSRLNARRFFSPLLKL